MNYNEQFSRAIAHLNAGQLDEAERLLKSLHTARPTDAECLNALGVIASKQKRHEEAYRLIEEAIRLAPQNIDYPMNLSLLQSRSGREGDLQLALKTIQDAIVRIPNQPLLLKVLARVHHAAGAYRDSAEVWDRLSRASSNADAELEYQVALNLELAGDQQAAIKRYIQALSKLPNHPNTIGRLAALLPKRDMAPYVVTALRFILRQSPNDVQHLAMLGSTLADAGELGESESILRNLAAQYPREPEFQRLLAETFTAAGKIEEAIASYKRLVELKPGDTTAISGVLMTSLYRYPDHPQDIFKLHRDAEKVFTTVASVLPAPTPIRSKSGRLRIGYISGDFCAHSVGYFIQPLLKAHDRTQFEIHCFNTIAPKDQLTESIKAAVEHWHQVESLSDKELSLRIREIGIDILIDLSGHTTHNRLTVLASRPATIQMTYLGYPATTGLSSIDYRITDVIADPIGTATDSFHSEALLRLPTSFALVSPVPDAPPVSSPPCDTAGHVTAGCVAAVIKVNDAVIQAWSKALVAVPDLRLLLIGHGYSDASVRQRLLGEFQKYGVVANRIEFVGGQTFQDYLALHSRIDLMLDTFPFNGHTTTVQNLWMGVPVVTYAGVSHRSRLGTSVLTTIGLTDLIAENESQYAEKIVQLASDRPRLGQLRKTLRERMQKSPLMDAAAFARSFEMLLLEAWKQNTAGAS